MDVYSPKKFRTCVPGSRNEYASRPEEDPKKTQGQRFNQVIKPEKEKGETPGEWVKRVFYERLKAFFEYEEVS